MTLQFGQFSMQVPVYPPSSFSVRSSSGARLRRALVLRDAILFTALLTVTASTAQGQSAGSRLFHGTVVNEQGQAVPNAVVVLKRPGLAKRTLGADVTDDDGAFQIYSAATDDLVVTVTHVAYASQSVSVSSSSVAPVTVQLLSSVLRHPVVEVSASRAIEGLTPHTVTNLDKAAIAARPLVQDIPVLLEQTPSVAQYSENGNGLGYTYLRLRGFDQKRLAVSINGIPQNDPESFDVFWINFFDIQSSISDIQVQRGAGGSFYGSTGIGGGINIVAMPYSTQAGATATVGYGSFNTRTLALEGTSGLIRGKYVAHARIGRTLSDGYRDWSWTEYWRYFTGIRRITDRSIVTLQAYGGPQKDALAYIGIPKEANTTTVVDDFGNEIDRRFNASAFTSDVERFRQPHLELHHEWSPTPAADFTQRFYLIRGIGHFDFDGSFRSANYLRLPDGIVAPGETDDPLYLSLPGVSVLFRAALDQWTAGWKPSLTLRRGEHLFTAGGELSMHRSLRWGRIEEAPGLPAELSGENDVRVYSVRGEKKVASIFGSALFRPTDRLAVQADGSATARGYRVFDEAFFGTSFTKRYFFINPRLGLTIYPEAPVSGFVSISYANREPRLKSLYDGEEAGAGAVPQFVTLPHGYDYAQPFVRPESVLDLELGARAGGPTWAVSATGYYMYFYNEIVPSGGLDQFGIPRTGNARRTRHVGLEVDARVRFLPGVDAWSNANFSRNRFVDFEEFIVDGEVASAVRRDRNPIAGAPEVLVNGGVNYTNELLSASVSARYRGRQYVDNSAGLRGGVFDAALVVDPFVMLDANVRVTPGGALSQLSVGLDVTNLTNRKVLAFGNSGFGTAQFFPAATRQVFFSATYSLR